MNLTGHRRNFRTVEQTNIRIANNPSTSSGQVEVKIFRNSFTTANAVPGVRRPSVAKAIEGRQVCARAVTLSPHSGECFRIRNKSINNEHVLKFQYSQLSSQRPLNQFQRPFLRFKSGLVMRRIKRMVPGIGVEPTTNSLGNCCSIH